MDVRLWLEPDSQSMQRLIIHVSRSTVVIPPLLNWGFKVSRGFYLSQRIGPNSSSLLNTKYAADVSEMSIDRWWREVQQLELHLAPPPNQSKSPMHFICLLVSADPCIFP